MNELVPAWTTIGAVIIVVATFSVVGLIITSTQIIIKKLKNKDE